MIKEKKKITKYNRKSTKKQIVLSYLRTIFCSVLFSFIITSFIAIHARNEIIKDITTNESEIKLDKAIAQKIIQSVDLIESLKTNNYRVCIRVGDLYDTVGDFERSRYAYETAIHKVGKKVYKPYYKLLCLLVKESHFDDAIALLENIKDENTVSLLKFKARSYIVLGDKYYSIGKFLTAAKNYEQAYFYYGKFDKKDSKIVDSISNRIINSYIQVADLMVKTGLNQDAIRFLKKAEVYNPNNYQTRYKLALVLADSDPEESIQYFEKLMDEVPQKIDYNAYGTALMKAANIADFDGRPTQAKFYRYKIHSIDLFVNRKVIYENDIEINGKIAKLKKAFFAYPIKANFTIANSSPIDYTLLKADFVLTRDNKVLETITKNLATKQAPLYSNLYNSISTTVKFNKKFYTKKELENYTVKVYLYKDEKFKTEIMQLAVYESHDDIF